MKSLLDLKRQRSCTVETCFLAERENRRLKVLLSSDSDRNSHVSCIFERKHLRDSWKNRFVRM